MDTIARISQETVDASLDIPSSLRPSECPVETWLAFLGHRWNALILWHLKAGPMRHRQLVDVLIGVTPKVLAERLSGLQDAQLITRRLGPGFPRTTTYTLTDRGLSLVAVLDDLERWSKAK